MPLFDYRALQTNGGVAQGQLEAAGRAEALRQMEGLGLRPISLAERAAAAGKKTGRRQPPRRRDFR
jgi:type II secretory pathway component PulF